MTNYKLILNNLTKTFGRRIIFNNLSYSFESNNIYGVAGINGSGKSTFVKIIANILSPTKGKVIHSINNKEIEFENLFNHIGFVAPYLILYDEFSAIENLFYFCKIRGISYSDNLAKQMLKEVNLFDRRNDLVKTYSSGMKQRLKYAFALIHSPSLLILDEPTSNLDTYGKDMVNNFIKEYGKSKLVIVASNEESDLKECSHIIEIEKYKTL